MGRHGMQSGKFAERAVLGEPNQEKVGPASGVRLSVERLMAEVRLASEMDPELPAKPFPKNLVSDIDGVVGKILPDDRYSVRYYSAVGTPLDYQGGVDFWVELYDNQEETVLSSYNVDLTMNPEKFQPAKFADAVYLFQESENSKELYTSPEYQRLVKKAAEKLLEGVSPILKQRVN